MEISLWFCQKIATISWLFNLLTVAISYDFSLLGKWKDPGFNFLQHQIWITPRSREVFTDQRIRILRPCAKKCKIYSCRTSKISKDYLLNFVLSLVLNSKPIIFVLCLYEKYLFKNHLWKCISYKIEVWSKQARGSKLSLKRDMTREFRPLKKEEEKTLPWSFSE